jgi:hypothetical protein
MWCQESRQGLTRTHACARRQASDSLSCAWARVSRRTYAPLPESHFLFPAPRPLEPLSISLSPHFHFHTTSTPCGGGAEIARALAAHAGGDVGGADRRAGGPRAAPQGRGLRPRSRGGAGRRVHGAGAGRRRSAGVVQVTGEQASRIFVDMRAAAVTQKKTLDKWEWEVQVPPRPRTHRARAQNSAPNPAPSPENRATLSAAAAREQDLFRAQGLDPGLVFGGADNWQAFRQEVRGRGLSQVCARVPARRRGPRACGQPRGRVDRAVAPPRLSVSRWARGPSSFEPFPFEPFSGGRMTSPSSGAFARSASRPTRGRRSARARPPPRHPRGGREARGTRRERRCRHFTNAERVLQTHAAPCQHGSRAGGAGAGLALRSGGEGEEGLHRELHRKRQLLFRQLRPVHTRRRVLPRARESDRVRLQASCSA